jgi:hypothetical protein
VLTARRWKELFMQSSVKINNRQGRASAHQRSLTPQVWIIQRAEGGPRA